MKSNIKAKEPENRGGGRKNKLKRGRRKKNILSCNERGLQRKEKNDQDYQEREKREREREKENLKFLEN